MRWIVTDNIYVETWRHLLEFANIELTVSLIERRHGKANNESLRRNYIKQAEQARVCVLQAKEYFDAARISSLFTSPNHAYYGAVSLASLCMLLISDGDASLDRLRADSRNNHHGLDLRLNCTAKDAKVGLALLDGTSAEVLRYGHFANWYKALPKRGSVYGFLDHQVGQIATKNYVAVGGYDVPKFDSIIGKKDTLLNLIKYLPDLDGEIDRAGIKVARSRTRHEYQILPGNVHNQTWFVHGCRTQDELGSILERFSISPSYSEALTATIDQAGTAAVVKLALQMPAALGLKWPTCRETLSHETISYADLQDTHEVVDLYLVAYQLSMLARYYPDIWISCLESRCRGAKLIEQCLDLLVRKLPILMLSIVCAEDVVVTTHRAPWRA